MLKSVAGATKLCATSRERGCCATDAASEPYLQRRHHLVEGKGFAGKSEEKVDKERQESIFEKLKEENRDRGAVVS